MGSLTLPLLSVSLPSCLHSGGSPDLTIQLLRHRRQGHSLCSEAKPPGLSSQKGNCQRQVPKVGERQGNWRERPDLKTKERQPLTSVNTPVQCSFRINLSKLK